MDVDNVREFLKKSAPGPWKLSEQEHGGASHDVISNIYDEYDEHMLNSINVSELQAQISVDEHEFEECARHAYRLKKEYQDTIQKANGMEVELNKKRILLDLVQQQRSSDTSNTKKPRKHDSSRVLSRACVVLVRTSGPVNVGQISRLCGNLGIVDLRLVDPQCVVNCVTARRFANRSVDFLLHKTRTYETLQDAIADCGLVIGTSGKTSPHHKVPLDPAQISTLVAKRPCSKFAVVFGNESQGLSSRELALCHESVFIPMDGWYQSFNLSQAVAITMYTISRSAIDVSPNNTETMAIRRDEMDKLCRYTVGTLERFGLLQRPSLDKQHARVMDEYGKLFHHVHITKGLYNVIHNALYRFNRVAFNDVATQMADTGRAPTATTNEDE